MRKLVFFLLAIAFATPASALDPAFDGLLVKPATSAEHRCRNAFLRLEFDALAGEGAAFGSIEAIKAEIDAGGKLIEGGCNPSYMTELRFCIPSGVHGAAGSRRWPPRKLAAHIAACLVKVEDRGVRAAR